MSLRWRLALVAVVAAAVLGGLMPHGVLAGTGNAGREMVDAVETPVGVPLACLDANCGKGTPTASSPTPVVALAAVLTAVAAAAVLTGALRRRRAVVAALPAGVRDPLFHPPRSS